MFRHVLYAVLAAACFMGAAAHAEIEEPKTNAKFAESLTVADTALNCTGTDTRTKYGFKIYAIAHYGAAAAAPKDGDAAARLTHWIGSSGPKAMVLKFVFFAPGYNIREACEEALDRVGYTGGNRESLLKVFGEDCPEGTELKLVALADGTLETYRNGESKGVWKQDAALVRAMWDAWLGAQSVLDQRENLVSRPDAGGAATPKP